MTEPDSDQEVSAIIDALDGLVDRVEHHLDSLQREEAAADASADPRYVHRVQRGIVTARQLLGVLDEDVQERIMLLRHNAHQLGYARQGKLV